MNYREEKDNDLPVDNTDNTYSVQAQQVQLQVTTEPLKPKNRHQDQWAPQKTEISLTCWKPDSSASQRPPVKTPLTLQLSQRSPVKTPLTLQLFKGRPFQLLKGHP